MTIQNPTIINLPSVLKFSLALILGLGLLGCPSVGSAQGADPTELYPFLGVAKPQQGQDPNDPYANPPLYGYKYVGRDGGQNGSQNGSQDGIQDEWAIEPTFEAANPFSADGYAWVRIGRAYCIIDAEGTVLGGLRPNLTRAITFDSPLYPAESADHTWGYLNQRGDWVIEPIFMESGKFAANGLAPAADINWRWGYINELGEWVIAPSFESAEDFSPEGIARVTIEGRLVGLIDQNGAYVVEPQLSYLSPYDSFGLARAERARGGASLIDRQGRAVTGPIFESIGEFSPGGLAIAETLQGLKGAVNTQGQWVIDPIFSQLGPFGTVGLAAAAQDDLYGLINTQGQWVVEPTFSEIFNPSDNGLARARDQRGRIGFIDSSGRFVGQPVCEWALDHDEHGFAMGRLDGLWGFLDLDGNWAIEPIFDDVGWFSENGLAPAKEPDGLWGYINRSGQWVIDPVFRQALSFDGQIARALSQREDWGIIDQSGNWLIDPEYMTINDFNEAGVAIVVKADDLSAGLIDRQCRFITYPQYRFCEDNRRDGLIMCRVGYDVRDSYFLTKEGQKRIPIDYDLKLERANLNLSIIDERIWWPQTPITEPKRLPAVAPESKPTPTPSLPTVTTPQRAQTQGAQVTPTAPGIQGMQGSPGIQGSQGTPAPTTIAPTQSPTVGQATTQPLPELPTQSEAPQVDPWTLHPPFDPWAPQPTTVQPPANAAPGVTYPGQTPAAPSVATPGQTPAAPSVANPGQSPTPSTEPPYVDPWTRPPPEWDKP